MKGHRVDVPAPHAALAHVALAAGHEAGHLHVAVRGAHLAHHLAIIIIQTRYRVVLSLIHLLEAVECGVWIVDVVLVHLVRQHEQVLLLGEPYHSLDIGAGQDLGRGDVTAN